jgi:hypothetical protein
MAERVAAHPGLYSTGELQPSLNGGRCRACGYVFFPPQSYGCESCGATPAHLENVSLVGSGILHSFATVHLHQAKGIDAPFTVGVIVLDEGPAVRSILEERTGEGLEIGDRMRSVMVAVGGDEDGRQVVELRFAKAGAGG